MQKFPAQTPQGSVCLVVLLVPLFGVSMPRVDLRSLAEEKPATAATPEKDAPRVGYDDGFFLRSEDGSSELVIEGLFQVVGGVFDGDREPGADVNLKRMRPELSGHVADTLRFKLETKFTEDEVELEEAWVGFEIADGKGLVMLGRMKAPFGLEEVRSRRHIDFSGFSILNQFSPAEDHGVFVKGRSRSGLVELGAAAYNGTGASDTNSSKDLAGRVMLHPFVADEGSPWKNLQFGLAGTIGRQDEVVGGDSIGNALGFDVVTFAPGVELSGRRWRAGLEGAWFHGPWFVQAEALALSQEMSLAGSNVDAFMRGAYLTLARVLTGEDKSFGGVYPADPFDLSSGEGRGAWVLAARFSELRVDNAIERASLSVPGAFTDRILTASLGLNWIPNDHAILRTSVVYSSYDDEVLLDSGSADSEYGLVVEFQLHF